MSDDELRNRFRRDFTNEVIGAPRRHRPAAAPPPEIPPARPAAHNPTTAAPRPMFPARPDHRHHPPPAPEPAAAAHHQPTRARAKPRQRRRAKKALLIILLIVILAGGAAGGWWFWRQRTAVPIPASIRSSLDFPLLYPTKLPAGYQLSPNSYTVSGSVLLFTAADNSSDKIAFTVQKRPAGFDFSTFYKQGLSNSTTFDTPVGSAAIGTASGKLLGSLSTDQSWMLVSSASPSINTNDIRLILDNAKTTTR